jgi:hypothetical protein
MVAIFTSGSILQCLNNKFLQWMFKGCLGGSEMFFLLVIDFSTNNLGPKVFPCIHKPQPQRVHKARLY